MTAGAVAAFAGLGAFHGLNPAMGWLFAVALGLQERSREALLRALPPIAAGHALSIALTVALIEGVQSAVSPGTVRLLGAAALAGFRPWNAPSPANAATAPAVMRSSRSRT
ncbi:MAG TPA: hypothetical protein VM823_06255, partial [Gaiellales bacterium]|nr:hypothetical protein [Gaiellales bacterium]